MNRKSQRTLFTLFLLLFSTILCGVLPAEARSELPPIGGLTVRQLAGHSVTMELLGTGLPLPRITANSPDSLVFSVKPAWLAAGKWERAFDLPLVESVFAEQTGDEVVFTVRVNRPLVLKGIDGVAPANRFFLRFDAAGHAAREREEPSLTAPRPAPPPNYNDPFTRTTPVTFDLRDVELRDVFRMLGAYAGMNIVADPSVPNTLVTMSLNDVPLNEALGYIMRMYEMTYAIMGRTIIIGTHESLSRTTGRQSTRAFRIAYGDLAAVGGLIQRLASVSSENISVDERLRTIYVTGAPEQFREVESLLQRVDHPGRQVMVQARIIEVNDDATDELGMTVDAVYNHWALSYRGRESIITYDYHVGREVTKRLDLGLRAIVDRNRGRVLANPSIITLDGVEAEVRMVQSFTYFQLDEAGNRVWSSEEVGPTVRFTPVVGRDNMITLTIVIETGEVVGDMPDDGQPPSVTRREVKTSIRVRDGEPFVVGGLHRDFSSTVRFKFPILGDIPFLGELFRTRRDIRERSEVAMIVIPYILHIPDAPVEQFTLR